MMQSRLDHLERNYDEFKKRQSYFEDHFVSLKEFQLVIKPLQDGLREMQRDIKEILIMLTRNESSR